MAFPIADEQLASQLKALAHPARLQIVDVLSQRGECVCGEIVNILPLTQSTVSQHLKILKDAGLLTGTIDGTRSCYRLNNESLKALGHTFTSRLANFEAIEQLKKWLMVD